MLVLGAFDPDRCESAPGNPYEWGEVRSIVGSWPKISRLVDKALAHGAGACTWRALILHRAAIAPLPLAARQTELLRLIRLYDQEPAGDASHTTRNLKREVLRTLATFHGDVPNATWNVAVRALRDQFDPLALQWAVLLPHLILANPQARVAIDVTSRNAALVELGRIATTAPDPAAPAPTRAPDLWTDPDPVASSWFVGGHYWGHRYAAATVTAARTYFDNWKHLMGRPCDPTLPADDVDSIFQCYPDLRAPAPREVASAKSHPWITPVVMLGGAGALVAGMWALARVLTRAPLGADPDDTA